MAQLPNRTLILHYNTSIKFYFSYWLIHWFNNDRADRDKLIEKIDSFICLIAKQCKMSMNELICKYSVFKVKNEYDLQSLYLMYDVANDIVSIAFFILLQNINIHDHNTRSCTKVHIIPITALDCRNFMNNCGLQWNDCPCDLRRLTKRAFIRKCKSSIIELASE